MQILHLESDRTDSALVRTALLAEGIPSEILRVDGRDEFVAALRECRFDLAIADFAHPKFDGFSVLGLIRQDVPDLPLIFFVADLNRELSTRAILGGAAEVVFKFKPAALVQAVRSALVIAKMRSGQTALTIRMSAEEKRLQEAAASLGQSFWLMNTETGRIALANEKFCDSVGLPLADLASGRFKFLDFIHPQDREHVARAVELKEGQGESRCDFRIKAANGDVRWTSARLHPVTEQGRITRVAAVSDDITARKHAEEALRDSEVLYHSLVENLPVFLFRKDCEGRFTFANRQFCEHIGRRLDQLRGATDFDVFPAELASEYRAGDRAVIETGRAFEADEEQITPDGRRLFIHVTKTALHDAKGNIIGVQGLFWNVTARRNVEEQLRESNQRLAATLKELKHTQQQVVQQERLHAMGQMSSGIAHDFNNTLMAILGFTELLLMSPETLDNKEKVISYLKTMSTAAKDAANVVKRLNNFYRHREEGLVFPPVDVNRVIEQVVALSRPRWKDEAQANGAHIEVAFDAGSIPPVPGHDAELRECLLNLLFNAIDAMPSGGAISLRTRTDGDAVVIEVSDTGTGMTEEVRKRCFEPFFSTKGQRGTGLGLSTVFGTIHRHQGTVEIVSQVGRGTRFVIRLPALKTADTRGGDTEILGLPVKPLSVLVVDDEPLIREILTEYLQADGHSVITAVDGREAMQRYREKHFDLVLTDRSMPHMSGDHLAEAIKQVDPRKPVVLLTGFGEMMKATGQKPRGVDVVMAKPVTMNGLRVSLNEAMALN